MNTEQILDELEGLGVTCLRDLATLGFNVFGPFNYTTVCGLLDWLHHRGLLGRRAFRGFLLEVMEYAEGERQCA